MITPLDMAITFLKRKIDSLSDEFERKIAIFSLIILKELSNELDSKFNIYEKIGFIDYVNFFVENDIDSLLELVHSIQSDDYFKYKAQQYLREYLILFKEKYSRQILINLYNLKNNKRVSN